ncbi:MAG: pilus assembly protein PilP [Sedimenticola sp.]
MSGLIPVRRVLWPVLISTLLLGGCAERNMGDLNQFVAEVKSRKAGHIEPLPEIKQIETFTYTGEGRRDPFLSSVKERDAESVNAGSGLTPDFNRRKEELESYALDSLRMVGILEQAGTTWALVRNQERTIFRVKDGNYMGINHGQITRITENQVELTEIVADPQGGYRERQASLALAE